VLSNRKISFDDDDYDYDLDTSLNLMLLKDACKLHNVHTPKVSHFVDMIEESPFCLGNFKTARSLVEIERKKDHEDWPPLETFEYRDEQVGVMRDADHQLDGEPDTSQLTTRKINAFL